MKEYNIMIDWKGTYKAKNLEDAIKKAKEDMIQEYTDKGFNFMFIEQPIPTLRYLRSELIDRARNEVRMIKEVKDKEIEDAKTTWKPDNYIREAMKDYNLRISHVINLTMVLLQLLPHK